MDGNALRVSLPTADDVQRVMPWAEDGASVVLAIPPGDLLRWRVRGDIRRPRWVALDTDWLADPRYQRLRDLVAVDGREIFEAVWLAVAFIAYELTLNADAVGLGVVGVRYPELAARRWHLLEGARVRCERAAAFAVRAGVFVAVDALDAEAARPWRPLSARRSGKETNTVENANASVRARTPASVDPTGPDPTGPDLTRSDPTGPGGRSAPGAGAARAGGRVLSGALPDGTRFDVGTDPAAAVRAIAAWCTAERTRSGRAAWPVKTQDYADLENAIARCILDGDIRPLFAVLQEANRDAKTGGYYHLLLQKRGLI